MKHPFKIAVIGGGMGGLSTAIAFQRRGMAVTVFEQAPELKEVGAGLGIGPNASRLLIRAGLKDRLDEAGVLSTGLDHFHWTGEPIEGISSKQGRDVYLCHRADFLAALLSRLEGDVVRLDHRLVGLEQDADKVSLQFANGEVHEADIVIGADGIHSVVRPHVVEETPPRSEAITAYRAMIPSDRIPWAKDLRSAMTWLGPGQSILCYPVSAGRQINLVAFVPSDIDIAESWSDSAQLGALLEKFASWDPRVVELIAATDIVFRTGIYDRETLPAWTRGRVTLLGDAAHAMVPHMGQGASQAIEDAFAIAALFEGTEPKDALHLLKKYEQIRMPRTSRVQNLARKAGELLRNSGSRNARDQRLGSVLGDLDWLFSHDAEAAVDLQAPRMEAK